MLTNKDISEMIRLIDDMIIEYNHSYFSLKQETFAKCENVRYSSGGNIYPFGKYFLSQSKLYRKIARQSTGHYCSTIENANFAYVYSGNGELIAIDQMFDPKKNNSGNVDYTSFVLSLDEKKYVLKYLEHYDKPILHEIGLITSDNTEIVMVHSDVPCSFLKIVLIDKVRKIEYLYSISREIFVENYSNCMRHDDIYDNYAELHF